MAGRWLWRSVWVVVGIAVVVMTGWAAGAIYYSDLPGARLRTALALMVRLSIKTIRTLAASQPLALVLQVYASPPNADGSTQLRRVIAHA